MFSLTTLLYLSALLFSIGTYGVLARRNILVVLMSLELMLNAVNIAIVSFGRAHALTAFSGEHGGQIFTLMVLAVAAAEAAIGLAILVVLFRNIHTINVADLDKLKG